MKNIQITIFILALLIPFPFQVYAQSVIDTKITYYPVSGNTVNQIRKSLNDNSPIKFKNRSYDAFTSWHVDWKFNLEDKDDSCELKDIVTTLRIRQTFPKLKNRPPEKVLWKWKKYRKALMNHERQHKDIAHQAAIQIYNHLTELSPFTHCHDLQEEANNSASKIIRKYIAKERLFDKRTQYGTKEGAVFP